MHLYRRVAARIESLGYEASLGALHQYRPGRLSMACDLMEPLRIPVVDRWVIAVCAQGMVAPSDFETLPETQGVVLVEAALSKVVIRMEEHWHQGNFELILESEIKRWTQSIKDHVTGQLSTGVGRLSQSLLEMTQLEDVDDHDSEW